MPKSPFIFGPQGPLSLQGNWQLPDDQGTNGQAIVSNGDGTSDWGDVSVDSVGDPGTEAGGVNINGTTYDAAFKVNDIGGSEPAQMVIHRHSTTLQAALVGSRTNSNTSSHSTVTSGMNLFEIFGAGWTGSHYDLFGSIAFEADSAGTISGTSAPGAISFKTATDGSDTPTEKLNIDNAGNLTMIAGSTTQFLASQGNSGGPGISFATDNDTGFYSQSPNIIGIGIAGFNLGSMSISSAVGLTFDRPFMSGSNPASFVQFTADGDTDTGMSIVDTTGDTLELITGGTARLTINTAVADFALPIKFPSFDDTGRDELSPTAGWAIFNTTSGLPEWYDGTNWIEADGTTA